MNSEELTRPQHSPDPLLDEIRAVKEAVSARAEHDVARLCRELRVEQSQSTRRIVHRPAKSR